jgi:hypothetical protein
MNSRGLGQQLVQPTVAFNTMATAAQLSSDVSDIKMAACTLAAAKTWSHQVGLSQAGH